VSEDKREPEVSLRLAEKSDALCLSALATQVFLETYATAGMRHAIAREVQKQFSFSAFLELLEEPSTRVVLAEREGHLVAFAQVRLGATHSLLPVEPAAELCRLYVQSLFVRRGIGSLLLQKAEALASAERASTLWVTAWVGNSRALAFYLSQGYEELGTTEHKFENECVENRLLAKVLRAVA
jgi:diamine N-acetyltransferase